MTLLPKNSSLVARKFGFVQTIQHSEDSDCVAASPRENFLTSVQFLEEVIYVAQVRCGAQTEDLPDGDAIAPHITLHRKLPF